MNGRGFRSPSSDRTETSRLVSGVWVVISRVRPSGEKEDGKTHSSDLTSCSAGRLRSRGIQNGLIGPFRFEAKARLCPSGAQTGDPFPPPEVSRSQELRSRSKSEM